ncbi:hypothetical protein LWI29_004662 [Acer saccharum]|uniref:Dehydrin n=1 Tax=Acer saccharum TaxID=4024 RepID=A0AA39W0U2_ACESA|nr:hypothetical protein LWI29_004662 [Acer saccharum]
MAGIMDKIGGALHIGGGDKKKEEEHKGEQHHKPEQKHQAGPGEHKEGIFDKDMSTVTAAATATATRSPRRRSSLNNLYIGVWSYSESLVFN